MELNSIAFIPDGNRRYAEKHQLNVYSAYLRGTEKAWDVLDWLVKYPAIKVGTFYTLSLENFYRRSALEKRALFKIFENELERIKQKTVFDAHKIRLNFIGRLGLFPKKLREKMVKAEEITAHNNKRTINLALAYNGQAEIVDAAKKLAQDYKDKNLDLNTIDEASFNSYLYDSFQSPDLILRTSGTKRLSGFLTYQSAYSELYFLNKFWPELTEQDLQNAVSEYNERQRRFGK